MPSIAANNTAVKAEKVPALDLPESFRSANTVIEKKCRNLEKRKIKLDGYREELARGRTLSEEQQLAAARYNEVVANLELTREFITAFDKIGSETSKEEKKKKKKEIFERQQLELARFKEVFMIQEVFQCLCSPSAREDFVNGFHGAPQLSESDLQKLDTFYSLVSIDRQNLPGGFNEVVTNSATHYQHLLEGRNKEVAGSTYKEIKSLVQTIINNGYFDWKAQPEVVEPETKEPEVVEPVQEVPTHLEPVYHSLPDEPAYVESGMEYIEPQAPLPIQPQVVPQATAYFPVDIDTDFNFIQESMIDTKPILSNIPASVPMPVHSAAPVPASLASMDSAVVMVHSQMPHLAYPHFAAAPMYAAHGAPLVPGPPSMQVPTSTQHHQPPPQQLHQQQQQQLPSNDLSGDSIGPDSSAALTSQVETQDNRATASSPWAEEPQDDIPTFQQDQSRNTESNTWTNSNYRSNDQDGRRGGYRGRGNGGPRGSRGGSGGGGSGYYSSRGGYGGGDRQGNGERTYQNSDRHQGNGGDRNGMDRGSYNQGGDRSYQSNNGGGRYQGNNGERNYQGGSYNRSSGDRGGSSYVPRGGYRGGPPRGAPRGSSSRGGGYERNPSYAKE